MPKRKTKDKYVTITTHDGTVLTIRDITDEPLPPRSEPSVLPFNLNDLLKAESYGPSDEAVSAAWLYGENGKAPR